MPVYGYNVISNHEFKILENEIYNYMINSGVVTEAFFTKKQLQDPNTLTKLLEKAEREKNAKKVVDLIFYGLTILESVAVAILTKSALLGFASWVPFLILTNKIARGLNVVMAKTQENRIKQLRTKCEKLINKLKNSDKDKAKEIVANCKSTIDAIDKYYKKIEKEKLDKKIKDIMYDYKFLIDIIHGEEWMDDIDPEVYALAEILGIPHDRVEKGMKNAKCYESLWIPWFGCRDLDDIKSEDASNIETIEIMSKYVPEFNDDKLVQCYLAIDDTVFFYSKKANKFYCGDYWYANYAGSKESDIPRLMFPSIIGYIKEHVSQVYTRALNEYKKDIDIIKVADIKLGYYLLSPAPDGVTPKKI